MTGRRLRLAACGLALLFAWGCVSTRPAAKPEPDVFRGIASWYGEEFAGRTTANGEIFDPLQMTAAHRTLAFGTVLDVVNPKTQQTVRVRVNDRGPYIGNRVIDLSYAAAEVIGLVEPGVGEVEIRVVKIGSGEREPPAPFEVAISDAAPAVVPVVPAPAPAPVPAAAPPVAKEEPVVVDVVEVEQERAGVPVRRQVAADGKSFEEVPVPSKAANPAPARVEPASPPPAIAGPAPAADLPANPAATRPLPRVPASVLFFVQVGAFSVEANANALHERLVAMGHPALVESGALYRVRVGPFVTRAQAVAARGTLEESGLPAVIVAERGAK